MCPKLRGLKRGSSLLVLPDSLHFHTRVRNTLTSADFWKDCIELEIRLEKICNFYMNTWICVYGIALDSLKPSLISLCRVLWGFPGSSVGKESACKAGDLGWIPGLGRSPWRRKWQPTPVFLPGESHGQKSLVGYSPWITSAGHDFAPKPPSPRWSWLFFQGVRIF